MKCNFELSKRYCSLYVRTLDEILKFFKFEQRDNGEKHDDIQGCELTVKIYMKLFELPSLKMATIDLIK